MLKVPLNLTGTFDFSRENCLVGSIKVIKTNYYELFCTKKGDFHPQFGVKAVSFGELGTNLPSTSYRE